MNTVLVALCVAVLIAVRTCLLCTEAILIEYMNTVLVVLRVAVLIAVRTCLLCTEVVLIEYSVSGIMCQWLS